MQNACESGRRIPWRGQCLKSYDKNSEIGTGHSTHRPQSVIQQRSIFLRNCQIYIQYPSLMIQVQLNLEQMPNKGSSILNLYIITHMKECLAFSRIAFLGSSTRLRGFGWNCKRYPFGPFALNGIMTLKSSTIVPAPQRRQSRPFWNSMIHYILFHFHGPKKQKTKHEHVRIIPARETMHARFQYHP